jgi:hypothetical protein
VLETPKIRSISAAYRQSIGFSDEPISGGLRKFMPFVGSAGPDGLTPLASGPSRPNTSP